MQHLWCEISKITNSVIQSWTKLMLVLCVESIKAFLNELKSQIIHATLTTASIVMNQIDAPQRRQAASVITTKAT